MKKLQLNKKTIQTLDKRQMQQIDGGLCLVSCASGSRKSKACCDRPLEQSGFLMEIVQDGPKTTTNL